MRKTYFFLIYFSLTIGIITSPNYPNNYPDNFEQTDTIRVEEGLVVAMQFTAFDVHGVQTSSWCRYDDYVTIKNGDGTTLMEKTCDSTLPAAITSTSNIVEIYFHTDSRASESGWSLTWRAVTPGAEASLFTSDCPTVWALADLPVCLISENFENCNAPLLTCNGIFKLLVNVNVSLKYKVVVINLKIMRSPTSTSATVIQMLKI